jgi:hypothetical protein
VGEAEAVASMRPGGNSQMLCLGSCKHFKSGGKGLLLGFRPRDDQSASTGEQVSTWFDILDRLGCYPPSKESGVRDHPVVLSRETEYLVCEFPNKALAVAPHFRHHEENWQGGFFRDEKRDLQALMECPVEDDRISLLDLAINGTNVCYQGKHCLAWRRDPLRNLIAFAGLSCSEIILDGITYQWSEKPVDIAWHPLNPEQGVGEVIPLYRAWCGTVGLVSLPLGVDDSAGLEVWVGAAAPLHRPRRSSQQPQAIRLGYGSRQIPFRVEARKLVLDVNEEILEHWLYIVRR